MEPLVTHIHYVGKSDQKASGHSTCRRTWKWCSTSQT